MAFSAQAPSHSTSMLPSVATNLSEQLSSQDSYAAPQVTPAAVRRRSGKAANGDGAQDLPDDVSRLVQRGNVLDWDGLEQTLQYVLYDQVPTRADAARTLSCSRCCRLLQFPAQTENGAVAGTDGHAQPGSPHSQLCQAWVERSTSTKAAPTVRGSEVQLALRGQPQQGRRLTTLPACAQLGWQAGDEGNMLLGGGAGDAENRPRDRDAAHVRDVQRGGEVVVLVKEGSFTSEMDHLGGCHVHMCYTKILY